MRAGERAGRRTGPGEENGPTGLHGPREEGKRKKRERWRGGPDGLETKRVRGKNFPFFFKKKNKHIQI